MADVKENTGPDLDRIGLFKEMSYHHEYVPVKVSFNEASKKGKQMMTTCSKTKAGNQDGFFARNFQRVFEGEAYSDRIRMNRLNRLENAKKNLTSIFKYSSPTKKPSGKGSWYGTFADYAPTKMEYFSSQPRDYVKSVPEKKNFYVNPPQKGTGYGYPNLTIGKMPPYFLESEYEELKNATIEPKKPQLRPFPPYRSGIFQQVYFDPNPFKSDVPLPEETVKEAGAGGREKEDLKPFLPSSPAKKDGGMKAGCLNPFPEYISDPYRKIDLGPTETPGEGGAEKKVFRPVPGVRPYPIKSIIDTNVKKQVNSTNFKTIKGVVYCKDAKRKKDCR